MMKELDFNVIKVAVAKRFKEMLAIAENTGTTLYRTGASKDALVETYLNSFPEGTNPIYRERTEHDCSSCKSFIRAVGNVVAIDEDNKVISIWDIDIASQEPAYQEVADALSRLVKASPIENVFLTTERTAGVDKNFEQVLTGTPIEWTHFFVNIPNKYIKRGVDIGTALSEKRSTFDVLKRGLETLHTDAINTVLDLIAQNSLYRGAEHQNTLTRFLKLKQDYLDIEVAGGNTDAFIWKVATKGNPAVTRIRNTSIGTLLIDLSNGEELEQSVNKFEAMVAPMNYKRPTALVTPAMVEKARQKVDELGFTSALNRRHAVLSDISINDILFADRSAKPKLSDNIFDEVASGIADKKPKNLDKVEEVSIDKFIADILPRATSLELMLENKHINNLMNIIAPQDPTANNMFKWANNFSWAYNGDVTDSLKERVKAAGGNVTGDLCCRLAWYNYDDLDLHMIEPKGGRIYYGTHRKSRGTFSPAGGQLDVDMNAGGGQTRIPVENIYYPHKRTMIEGEYTLIVNQYSRRESDNVGFEIEVDFLGTTYNFEYNKSLRTGENVEVMKFTYSHKDGIKIIESLPSTTTTKEVWGLTTNKFHKVNLMMYSPNHWESSGTGVGNKHFMFILADCNNPDPARGFFNEYLDSRLDEHRKVFELVGSKAKAEPTKDQLAGLGFSSTQKTEVLCRVEGSINRVIKLVI